MEPDFVNLKPDIEILKPEPEIEILKSEDLVFYINKMQ